MQRIDAHHHVWDLSVRDQAWLTGDYNRIRRSFSMDDFIPELSAAGMSGAILVQTQEMLEETEEFLDLAAEHDEIVGVVGWLSLDDPDAMNHVARYLAHPNGHWLVGVRDMVQSIEDPQYLLRPQVIANLQALGERGITFDLLTRPPQLAAAVEVVRAAPETRFVMDHLSKPDIAAAQFADWADQMTALAASSNVAMKVSGMVTEATWDEWSVETFQPYIAHVLNVFGPDRCMFGSDWPVCLAAATYAEVVQIAEHATAGLPESERAAFWAGTAIKSYQLQSRM